jgi:hypothetical protein
MGNEVKSARRLFKFSLDEKVYKDVIEVIISIPKPFRGHFIAESIRVARKYYTPQSINTASADLRGVFKFGEE